MTQDRDAILSAQKRQMLPFILYLVGGTDVVIGLVIGFLGPSFVAPGDVFIEQVLAIVGVIMILSGLAFAWFGRRTARKFAAEDGGSRAHGR